MSFDIVPRAFACDYTLVADLLKRVSDAFREHACLNSDRTVGGAGWGLGWGGIWVPSRPWLGVRGGLGWYGISVPRSLAGSFVRCPLLLACRRADPGRSPGLPPHTSLPLPLPACLSRHPILTPLLHLSCVAAGHV